METFSLPKIYIPFISLQIFAIAYGLEVDIEDMENSTIFIVQTMECISELILNECKNKNFICCSTYEMTF